MKDFDIVLTADRTIMNDMHKDWRLCIPSWSSSDWMPHTGFDWWVPQSENTDGIPRYAPLSLRKLESVLTKRGYRVAIVVPERLPDYLPRTSCLGINSTDPCGKGFSPLYLEMFRKNNIRKEKFERLLNDRHIQKARSEGMKVVVGGGGTWQFDSVPKQMDCLVDGEAERILPHILDKIAKNEPIPRRISCEGEFVPDLSDIPTIEKPTQFGLLEVGRGCFRRCEFCTVSRKPYWIPIDVLERENRMTVASGLEHIQLLSEDILLYGSKNVRPEPQKFNTMIEKMAKDVKFLTFTHFSISALNCSPSLFESLHEHLPPQQKFTVAQTGIETGSESLLNAIAPTKKHPLKERKWKDMVLNASNIIQDSVVFPYYTILLGCEKQTEHDASLTLELMDELKHTRSVFMPCLYTLKHRPHKKVEDLLETEKETVRLCLTHNMKWYSKLSDMVFDMYPSKRFLRRRTRDIIFFYAKMKLRHIISRI